MKNQKLYKLAIGLFAIYILSLVWIILFKLGSSLTNLPHYRNINLIPFSGSVIVNGKIFLSEIIGNILIFIPFGIYICLFKGQWNFIKKVIPVFVTSLTLEVLQFILAIGATDITDVIGNTLGGIIGISIYYIFLKIFKDKTFNIIVIIALIATIIMLGLIGILFFVNM